MTTTKTEAVVKTAETSENVKDNRDKVVVRKTTTTKTKYYPPVKTPEPTKDSPVPEIKSEPELIVESVETTIIEEKETDQGVVESKVEQKQSEKAKVNEESEIETKVTEKAKKPIAYGWIFGIFVIIAGVGFYLNKKFAIIDRVKKLFK